MAGRRGGRGELTEPGPSGPPRPGRGGGRARGTRRPEVRLPRVRSQHVSLHWRAHRRRWLSGLLQRGGRGGVAGVRDRAACVGPGVPSWSLRFLRVRVDRPRARSRPRSPHHSRSPVEPGGALPQPCWSHGSRRCPPHFTDKETGHTGHDRRRGPTRLKHLETVQHAHSLYSW